MALSKWKRWVYQKRGTEAFVSVELGVQSLGLRSSRAEIGTASVFLPEKFRGRGLVGYRLDMTG